MHAFIALGEVKQATLAMVAPGIAEALVATAMGLFAAIPAVMAYNRLSNKVGKLEHSYATFSEEFHSILHRQAVAGRDSASEANIMAGYQPKKRKMTAEINVVPILTLCWFCLSSLW